MRFRGFGEATAVVLGAVVLACVFTYPYIIQFNNAGRLDTNDGRWSIWVVSWVAHALTTDPRQLFSANIFYPHTNALAFSEGNIVEGAIGAPVWALTKNPYTTHNFVFLFAFAQSFVATYYLVRRLTGDRRAAIIAGIMYAYCPFVFARQAHIQLLMIGFLPWCMLAWHRFLDRTVDRARDRARRGDVPDRPGVRVLRHLRRRHGRVREHLVRDHAAALEDMQY